MISEHVTEFLVNHLGRIPYIILAFFILGAGPVVLLMLIGRILSKKAAGSREGLLLGLVVALWINVCVLAVGYLGVYPSLPAVLLLELFGVETAALDDALWKELLLVATNFVLWTGLCWVVIVGRNIWLRSGMDRPSPTSNDAGETT